MKKVYFAQYGAVYSLTKANAILVAEKAANGQTFLFTDYGKQLKKQYADNPDYIRVGNNYHEVEHCLDYNAEDWADLLKRLKQ